MLHPDGERPNYLLDLCCTPVPGDDVLGFVNDDEEVVVHKVSCPKAMRLKSSFGERLVQTVWGELADKFMATIAVEGIDRPGVLEEIAGTLSLRLGINLRGLNIEATDEVFTCRLTVQVDSTQTLDAICRALLEIKGVRTARRVS